ncbi:DJ-1/PfpI family protein [bacterium]|nr:DJ-1/PfpI family protein [bacterium]
MVKLFSIFFLFSTLLLNCAEKKVLMIIAFENFRDEELVIPRRIIQKNGFTVKVASWKKGIAKGMLGTKVKVDMKLDEVNVDEFEGVIFVGGIGATKYFNDKTAHRIAKEFYKKKKVIGAICFGPVILANADILKGKRATCFYTKGKVLISKGAKYTGKEVEVDGLIITGNGPKAAEKFGYGFLKLLKSSK